MNLLSSKHAFSNLLSGPVCVYKGHNNSRRTCRTNILVLHGGKESVFSIPFIKVRRKNKE